MSYYPHQIYLETSNNSKGHLEDYAYFERDYCKGYPTAEAISYSEKIELPINTHGFPLVDQAD